MSMFYRRRPPAWQETAASVLAAASIGAVTFYLTRMLLARDAVPAEPPVREAEPDRGELPSGRKKGLRRFASPEAGSE